jgi:D-alanine-D-alanine ligase-like ATP-grasp enzyme
VTNIHTLEEFKSGVDVAKKLCAYLSVEEHLMGDVCRATFVNGKLMGFYRGGTPYVVGDGMQTIEQLIQDKDENRPERVEKIIVNQEMRDFVARLGFQIQDVLPSGLRLALTYRTGRLYGGVTREMLDELHPSFVPTLTKAAEIVDLPVIGFDCIVPDPTADASTQRWGIIECNTLPFIDLHYYALEGKPKNIAGAIWDMWRL